jgi:serine/threonine-protein kinase
MGARDDRPPYLPHDTLAGKYRVRRILGEGGMAVVYAAIDTTCDRQVAIKVLRPRVAARRSLSSAHLQREAATVVRLLDRTPHVAEVLTAGITDDEHRLPYYVMERLFGETLRAGIEEKRAQQHPFEILEVATTVIEIATPLAHAHQMGIVHRDVKPENVFLAEQRDGARIVKLIDFGLSALVDGDDEPRASGPRVFSGSRQYASPEQLDGRGTTPASDVYSLGLILYEMLTLKLPHDRHNPALSPEKTALNVLEMPLGDLRKLRADIPPRLEAILENCLEHDPELRPTALQVASRLRDVKRAFEHDLLGSEAVAATDVTGPPVEVLLQRLDTATSDPGAPVGRDRDPRTPHALEKVARDEEVFFLEKAVDRSAMPARTDPIPQRIAAVQPAPTSVEPQRVLMVQGVTEVPPPPKTLPLPPKPPDSTVRLPAMTAAQAASAATARAAPPDLIAPAFATAGTTPSRPAQGFGSRTDSEPSVARHAGLRREVWWLVLAACVAVMAVIAVAPGALAKRAAERAAAAASASAATVAATRALPAPMPSSSAPVPPVASSPR